MRPPRRGNDAGVFRTRSSKSDESLVAAARDSLLVEGLFGEEPKDVESTSALFFISERKLITSLVILGPSSGLSPHTQAYRRSPMTAAPPLARYGAL